MNDSNQTELTVCKRDGRMVGFDSDRIATALRKAFAAELNVASESSIPHDIESDIAAIVSDVIQIAKQTEAGTSLGVEQIQDIVEIGLMQRQHYRVSRRYILYRTEQARIRAIRHQDDSLDDVTKASSQPSFAFHIEIEPGVRVGFNPDRMERYLKAIPEANAIEINVAEIVNEVVRSGFDGMTPDDVARSLVLTTRSRIERDPAYDRLAAALQLSIVYRHALGTTQIADNFTRQYRDRFEHMIVEGIREGRLSGQLRDFDLARLREALRPDRDQLFRYLGVQTIYDRYLLHVDGRRIETPQYFWMRIAMGLALAEPQSHRTDRAIEFYDLLSSFRFTSATPTLFNSGTQHPQLSSCYLTTVQDDLEDIFACISDNAMLSKWAGGLGNDWTSVRATGSLIKGTNGTSQGVIPFLKVVNDAAVAVNQGGKRKGAVCAYLEPWHLDFEEFLDLRKNTGDDRRRTHDMHTAAWIPDLFMQRVREEGQWTLFSPNETPDLHDLYGVAFKERYEHYEEQAAIGLIKQFRQVSAVELWRKLLTRTFETGHPWVTFKDPSNIRSPQDHTGVVHSSNLCTEILLNTNEDETAVCNLGSINLAAHIIDGEFDHALLRQTITTAMRMLDNVIDINFYPTPKSRNANLRHRPVGLGMMGFQDALQKLGLSYASEDAMQFADESSEAISYFAILASSKLAEERGTYETYQGSKWDRGLLPIDTIEQLAAERGEEIEVNRRQTMDWEIVRKQIAACGMRNSNCLAIAPTATISTIIGVTQSIEPTYKYLYAKSNLSGDFIQVHNDLVDELKQRGLWNAELLDELKYHDGTLAEMPSIPDDVKALFCSAFEIDPRWLIDAAARRQKWIDQGQSLNLYVSHPSGKAIDAMYQLAWQRGLKTTYYLRSLAATQVEKSTVDVNRHGIQPRWMKSSSSSSEIRVDRADPASANLCSLEDPECEACQ
ncbi:ribonucleoside-diphosphate reductase subunit alpha [Stieleria sp. JC731]|uniref:ribonucleoside-diphosphate reductase subunit alpha n=1 Tax=Pirellulaceae TaxID=2691357 RepID=UPI001E3047D2|nr:ribonucleoside-diphosphate reductase subunit alpha [Stieleria sp. JC731]MCC9600066.1 ribonucleoside-diphosphate reductase subunit alpha [Stieleria sp. JC731]